MTSATTTAPSVTPIPVPVAPPPGYWQREASHFPQPLTPAFRYFLDWGNDVWLGLAHEHGMMFDGVEFAEIGGWVYQRLRPMGGKDRKAPPAPLMWVLVRTVPQLRKRVRTLLEGQRNDLGMQQVDQWLSSWKQEQIETIARLRAVDPAALSNEGFRTHAAEVSAFARESVRRHFELTMPIATVAELAFFCEEKLGWSDRQTIELLSGLSVASTEPARQLARLAKMAAENPALRQAIKSSQGAMPALGTIDADFAAAFEAYQHDFGCRALRYEIVDPTLEEVPALTLGLIRDQLARGYDPEAEARTQLAKRDAALAKARTALMGKPPADRDRFEELLGRAERYYPTREDNEFYTISAPTALLRYVTLEYGRRLAQTGVIEAEDDVFFLEATETAAGLNDREDRRELVARRKGERAWVLAHPAPASFGVDPGPPPSLGVFPKDAAHNIRMVLWATEKVFGPDAGASAKRADGPPAGGAVVKGIAAAPGSYTGPVRVIMDETEFEKIEPGDVLVCPITSPVWSIIFPSVGALVTDTGGILSHPAIISREYGIPAVVATGNATGTLKDGQVVTVDGATGTVVAA